MKVSICVSAYNEEENIGRLLRKLSELPYEVVVVASGCTDRTVEIAKSFAPKVRTLVQEKREGKASAINMFLSKCDADIIILESADTLPGHRSLEYLLSHFTDDRVGMVGAHPIPANSTKTLMGRISHLIWESHHQLALQTPKAGEVVAFRRVIDKIDPNTAVDEAFIEREIVKQGLKVVYEPQAVIFNRGPETMEDFVRQRRRIYGGHIALRQSGYEVSTMSKLNILRATLKTSKNPLTLLVSATLEMYCRFTAREQETIWEMACTTKVLR